MQLPPLHGHPLLQLGLRHLPEVPVNFSCHWGVEEMKLAYASEERNCFVSREGVFQQFWHPFKDVEIVKEGQKYKRGIRTII